MALNGEAGPVDVFGTDYPTPDGTCIRDYIHVEDLAEAHVLALDYLANEQCSLRVNLGTGRGISVQEIINAVEEVTGLKVPLNYAPRRPGDPAQLVADPSLAETTLGWKAKKLDIRETVRSSWAWMTGPRKGRYTA
jgi:UDP-glucose 4-epimerase